MQIGYIPTAWKLATLRMLLKPDKLPSLTISYRLISLTSSVMKLFERVIEQKLRFYEEGTGFINNYQSGFGQNKSTDYHLFNLPLSIFSKIYEKIMYARLYQFLEKSDLFYSLQFGFRAKHSNDALISIIENIKESIDNNKFGCRVFLDLKKAFHTVNHKILLGKLQH